MVVDIRQLETPVHQGPRPRSQLRNKIKKIPLWALESQRVESILTLGVNPEAA